jgi:hypothetical protein
MLKNIDDRAITMTVSVEWQFLKKWREYILKLKGIKQKDIIKKILDDKDNYFTHPWKLTKEFKAGIGLSVRMADRERILNLNENEKERALIICTLLNSYMEQNPISEEA